MRLAIFTFYFMETKSNTYSKGETKMTYQVFICNSTEATKMEKILKMLTGDEGLGPYTHTETFAINERESYCTYAVVCTRTIKRIIQEYCGMADIR